MPAGRTVIGLVALAWVLCTGGSGARLTAAAPELKKVHILMVFDTSDPRLGKSLEIDQQRLLYLWKSTIPLSRHTLKVLEGSAVNRERILAYYRDLKVDPDEGLVFVYGGHGAIDRKTGQHFLQLTRGKPLVRSDLRKAMEAKKASLVVLLTDCCSTASTLDAADLKDDAPRSRGLSREMHPTVRCLLFQARGTVDVTAAKDNAAWSDRVRGGLFTRSLCLLMQSPPRALDTDGDGFVSWREFFPQLRRETVSLFGAWKKDWESRGESIDARTQQPFAFHLGKDIGVIRAAGAELESAAVRLRNSTREVVSYRFRWKGEARWSPGKLKAGETRSHSLPVEGGKALPHLEVKVDGVSRTLSLKSGLHSGKLYRIDPN
jgi:hypothetical protein